MIYVIGIDPGTEMGVAMTNSGRQRTSAVKME